MTHKKAVARLNMERNIPYYHRRKEAGMYAILFSVIIIMILIGVVVIPRVLIWIDNNGHLISYGLAGVFLLVFAASRLKKMIM